MGLYSFDAQGQLFGDFPIIESLSNAFEDQNLLVAEDALRQALKGLADHDAVCDEPHVIRIENVWGE